MNVQSAGSRAGRVGTALVIDDHPLYCDALVSALTRVFADSTIRTATTLEAGLDVLRSGFAPGLIVLDLKLPDVTGISGFLRLKAASDPVPILINSAMTSPEIVASLMEAGAAGFVPKDVSIGVLQTALREVRAGRRYLPMEYRSLAGRKPECARTPAQQVARRIADLTPQQARIMKLICAGMPNKQIAYELSLAEATVKAHITAILRRLDVQNRTQAALLMESATLADRDRPEQAEARNFLTH
ncbi:response regulator transcription factor [uncultured Jannaschia sp.]|uniref:LuxR C-terminal-related transcriptional regulator n=1 Tax=uncultured Jannaschia sp. TaxID=293347 RepID=UPI0026139715|nr:response regulator transcription factor [uncultured Jannaschia sp.]